MHRNIVKIIRAVPKSTYHKFMYLINVRYLVLLSYLVPTQRRDQWLHFIDVTRCGHKEYKLESLTILEWMNPLIT